VVSNGTLTYVGMLIDIHIYKKSLFNWSFLSFATPYNLLSSSLIIMNMCLCSLFFQVGDKYLQLYIMRYEKSSGGYYYKVSSKGIRTRISKRDYLLKVGGDHIRKKRLNNKNETLKDLNKKTPQYKLQERAINAAQEHFGIATKSDKIYYYKEGLKKYGLIPLNKSLTQFVIISSGNRFAFVSTYFPNAVHKQPLNSSKNKPIFSIHVLEGQNKPNKNGMYTVTEKINNIRKIKITDNVFSSDGVSLKYGKLFMDKSNKHYKNIFPKFEITENGYTNSGYIYFMLKNKEKGNVDFNKVANYMIKYKIYEVYVLGYDFGLQLYNCMKNKYKDNFENIFMTAK